MDKTTEKWWEKLGKPQYGGELTYRLNRKIVNLDPYYGVHLTQIHTAWMEKLFVDDWTLNPEIFDYVRNLRPNEYVKGHLAESYEFKDPKTFVVHLRKGIHWQDIPPANGRELVAEDIAFHFNRMYGLGNGYTEPSPARTGVAAFKELASITCPDKYTVVFNWKS